MPGTKRQPPQSSAVPSAHNHAFDILNKSVVASDSDLCPRAVSTTAPASQKYAELQTAPEHIHRHAYRLINNPRIEIHVWIEPALTKYSVFKRNPFQLQRHIEHRILAVISNTSSATCLMMRRADRNSCRRDVRSPSGETRLPHALDVSGTLSAEPISFSIRRTISLAPPLAVRKALPPTG